MNSESENVLKALSSSTRRTIMRQISEKGSATYTEIMQVLDLDPSLMSGKFNYHLKELNEAGLIEKTNGEYKITDLGQRGLILVDQVAKDVKIDRYGVLSAVMSMSPTKEFSLFASQMGIMIGFMVTILSIVPLFLNWGTGNIVFWFSGIVLITALTTAILSTVKFFGIVTKYKLGISIFVFMSSNWFFIRSANRNRFLIITMLTIGAFVSGALAFLLPISGEFAFFSFQWYQFFVPAVTTGILTVWLLLNARKKARELEEINSEQ
ncbi:MAG: winged helix-turn-helix domain-containing protein [Candidatus Thorarchaeota archaeon]|jgi:DNA-binding transcriptional ArsR family regulator